MLSKLYREVRVDKQRALAANWSTRRGADICQPLWRLLPGWLSGPTHKPVDADTYEGEVTEHVGYYKESGTPTNGGLGERR